MGAAARAGATLAGYRWSLASTIRNMLQGKWQGPGVWVKYVFFGFFCSLQVCSVSPTIGDVGGRYQQNLIHLQLYLVFFQKKTPKKHQNFRRTGASLHY